MNKKTLIIILIIVAVLLFTTGFLKGKGSGDPDETTGEPDIDKDTTKETTDSTKLTDSIRASNMRYILNNSKIFNSDYYIDFSMSEYYVDNFLLYIKELKSELLAWFTTDESQIISIFEELKFKSQVSYLAYKYKNQYSRSLRDDMIQEKLSDETLIQLYNIFDTYA